MVKYIPIIKSKLEIIRNQNPEFISSDVKTKFNIINTKLAIITITGKLFFVIYSI